MVLTGPAVGTTTTTGAARPVGTAIAAGDVVGGALGDCLIDQFNIVASPPTPTICGYNSGQHSKCLSD